VARPRHPAFVRICHWAIALSVVGLLVSGAAILLAHPRLYWGETGAVGAPSLVDLPLPFVFGHSGWGRYLHFTSAWMLVLMGAFYVLAGLVTGQFRARLLPSKADLTWCRVAGAIARALRGKRSANGEAGRYNVVQQLTYLAVVFVLLPAMVWTGLAMSPSVTSVWPFLVDALGGQQSARTIHFFVANLLVLFFVVHVAMLLVAGFFGRTRAMITG
jgi:thiosulfate reductase cytochrome b subunit